jgi:hypothetical protein
VIACGALPVILARFTTVSLGRHLLFIFTALMILISLFASYYIANALLDDAPASKTIARVIQKKASKGKTSHTYWLYVKPSNNDETYKVDVPLNFYNDTVEEQDIILCIKPGYFGKRWLSKFERITTTNAVR